MDGLPNVGTLIKRNVLKLLLISNIKEIRMMHFGILIKRWQK